MPALWILTPRAWHSAINPAPSWSMRFQEPADMTLSKVPFGFSRNMRST